MKAQLRLVVLLIIGMCFISCPTETDDPDNPITPQYVDTAFWFGEIHDQLISRIGGIDSDEYTGPTGEDMGQVANCQYVCNAINAYKSTNFQPIAGTALQAANCEYLLKMIDKANNNATNYGTSSYATKQVIDTIAVSNALNKIILFQPKSYTTPGSYQLELPPGTYKMTAVSGKGGNGGGAGSGNIGGFGASGTKASGVFTISATTTVTVIVGGNGNSLLYNGSSSDPGLGGGGGGGASGIVGYYYVGGAGGGGGSGGSTNGSGSPGSTDGRGGNGWSANGSAAAGGEVSSGGAGYGNGGNGGSNTLSGGAGGEPGWPATGGKVDVSGAKGGYGYGGGGGGGGTVTNKGNGGGGGGGGGALPTGTRLSGTATTESPYVSIELN